MQSEVIACNECKERALANGLSVVWFGCEHL